jgi:hypothetical protein
MRTMRSLFLPGFAATTLFLSCCLVAQAQNRIVQGFEGSAKEAVRGNVHRLARPEFDEGSVAGSTVLNRIVLTFKPTASQQAELDALLEESDRHPPSHARTGLLQGQ